jgi:indolepyruvate ferredoxin oxidoreductase
MVLLMDPRQVGDVAGVTQMGGEGAQWIGMAPFVSARHFVQNIGDGTFMHSGSLALRAAVASGENITYKLLYNGTVAMTGGQDPVGEMDLPRLTSLLVDEGVSKIVVTSDDPKRTRALGLPKKVEVRHRDELVEVQTELAGVPGVTVLVHDQHCAAEKRRKRKRGTMPTPTTRVMINERICEGCGDCGEKSNCLSVHPVQTEFGRKTQIDQSSCNLDYSCLKGDCPSFVTVTPGTTRTRARATDLPGALLPEPTLPAVRDTFSLRVTGIGGTGVVTVSQVLATAAVLDGHAARTVDMTGLAQKGGAVVSDIKVAPHEVEQAAKVASDDCDLYLVCDPLVGTDPVNLKVAAPEKTVAVVSTTQVPTGLMVIDTSVGFPAETAIHSAIDAKVTRGLYLDSGALSTALFGDEQFANMLMVGAAYQAGALAISASSIERAIELNGVAVDANVQAFRRGRQAVADADAVSATIASLHGAASTEPEPSDHAMSVVRASGFGDELTRTVALRYDELIAYADERYAREYLDVVERVHRGADNDALTDAVARNLYKLLAYKDEYEVARLTQDAAFAAKVADQFGEDAGVSIRLHPPTLRQMGMREKMSLGAWANRPMSTLAKMKKLRGTPLDPFGRNEIRRTERALIVEYREIVDQLLAAVQGGRVGDAEMPAVVELAGLPDMVRGYESVKMRNVEKYRAEVSRLRGGLGI